MKSSIGERIKELREQRGLTQVELARRSGISQGQISSIERGKRGYTSETIEALARTLGATAESLIIDDGLLIQFDEGAVRESGLPWPPDPSMVRRVSAAVNAGQPDYIGIYREYLEEDFERCVQWIAGTRPNKKQSEQVKAVIKALMQLE